MPALVELPYALIFSVQTIDQVLIYSTESIFPLAVIGNLHYAYITDMAWLTSHQIIVSSYDGYCSTIQVDPKLTGEELPIEEVQSEDLKALLMERQTVNFQEK